MRQLKYQVEDATLAEVLGVSNFSNVDSAMLELVKNSYDAGASKLTITFSDNQIIVADTGEGMSEDDIVNSWMRVGKSDKGYSIVDSRGGLRIQAGSKGVGRFALARLGSQVEVSAKREKSTGVIWRTDWNTSTLELDDSITKIGTTIRVSALRDRWTEGAVKGLREYLSKMYDDDAMAIVVEYGESSMEVPRYFDQPKLGLNCTEIIRFAYDSEEVRLDVNVQSDEFNPASQALVADAAITGMSTSVDMAAELYSSTNWEMSETEFVQELKAVGPFSAELYFRLTGLTHQAAKDFEYQYYRLAEPFDSGVILYRNAFSISSYEGNKDWIGLGRRARKSPASPAHPTGSWRIRENQLAGKVSIDKRNNPMLRDMANRQGLEENLQYDLFLAIIDCALKAFERYRQGVIRSIVTGKERNDVVESRSSVSDAIASDKLEFADLSEQSFKDLKKEIKEGKREERNRKRKAESVKEQYRYDVRILNVLATSGLKAASIAHQLRNDENNILNNSRYVREALIRYGLWDVVSLPENTAKSYRDIPGLLEKGEKLNAKMVAFLGAMLGDIEKDRFSMSSCDVIAALNGIELRWKRDYSQLSMQVEAPDQLDVAMPEDAIQVIFDNLILNSLQQNSEKSPLNIVVSIKRMGDFIGVVYRDDGVGLHDKYKDDPRRILEVHETTRPKGHGLGMWIVNNTLLNYNCSITEISVEGGFSIEFSLKEVAK